VGRRRFLVLLNNKDLAQSADEMNATRKKVADHVFIISGNSINFTISIGISQVEKQGQEFKKSV
jgi:GGDEF domain-containing protein